MKRGILAAPILLLFLRAGAWAGPSMTSGNNSITRSVDDDGGLITASASNKITSSVGEVSFSTMASATNKIRGGWGEIAFYPGTLTALTVQNDVSASSATLLWNTPGVDGALGTLPSGSSYIVQVASNGFTSRFANAGTATVTISTSASAVGGAVSAGVTTGLDPNTTFFVQLWTQDNDGNVSSASPISTITTLASAPSLALSEFLSVQATSITVAWAALQANVSSNSCEGYVLQVSSNNFGQLAPAGAPVFSSATADVKVSTLSVGVAGVPLDLSNTYYLQVGSLNWTGATNYTTLTRLNFQILQSTGLLHLGAIDPSVALSTISTSSMNVVNIGNWPVTLVMSASTVTAGGSHWALSTVLGVDTVTLQGVWYGGSVGPPPASFTTYLTTVPRVSQTGAGNNYVGTQNGVQLAPGANITMWFRFFLPTTSSTVGPETFQLTSQPVYP
jgi:hypothetical protein